MHKLPYTDLQVYHKPFHVIVYSIFIPHFFMSSAKSFTFFHISRGYRITKLNNYVTNIILFYHFQSHCSFFSGKDIKIIVNKVLH